MNDIYQDMDDALQEVITRHEAPLRINRWVVIAETLSAEGQRELWQMSSKQNKAWDTKGMLAHAMDYEIAKGIQAVVSFDDQGE